MNCKYELWLISLMWSSVQLQIAQKGHLDNKSLNEKNESDYIIPAWDITNILGLHVMEVHFLENFSPTFELCNYLMQILGLRGESGETKKYNKVKIFLFFVFFSKKCLGKVESIVYNTYLLPYILLKKRGWTAVPGIATHLFMVLYLFCINNGSAHSSEWQGSLMFWPRIGIKIYSKWLYLPAKHMAAPPRERVGSRR